MFSVVCVAIFSKTQKKISQQEGVAMRLNCLVCGDVLVTKNRPPHTNHHDTVQQEMIFKSYQHCKNCGASIVATISMRVIRERFNEPEN